ncbi:hypothetical protein D3C71_1227310 [compost metagenome]
MFHGRRVQARIRFASVGQFDLLLAGRDFLGGRGGGCRALRRITGLGLRLRGGGIGLSAGDASLDVSRICLRCGGLTLGRLGGGTQFVHIDADRAVGPGGRLNDVLRLLDGLQAHQQLGRVQLAEETRRAIAKHDFFHRLPFAAGFRVPAFLDGHFDGHLGRLQALAGFLLDGPGHADLVANRDGPCAGFALTVVPAGGRVLNFLVA